MPSEDKCASLHMQELCCQLSGFGRSIRLFDRVYPAAG